MLKTERFELGSLMVRNGDSKEASETRETRWTQPGSFRDPSVTQPGYRMGSIQDPYWEANLWESRRVPVCQTLWDIAGNFAWITNGPTDGIREGPN